MSIEEFEQQAKTLVDEHVRDFNDWQTTLASASAADWGKGMGVEFIREHEEL